MNLLWPAKLHRECSYFHQLELTEFRWGQISIGCTKLRQKKCSQYSYQAGYTLPGDSVGIIVLVDPGQLGVNLLQLDVPRRCFHPFETGQIGPFSVLVPVTQQILQFIYTYNFKLVWCHLAHLSTWYECHYDFCAATNRLDGIQCKCSHSWVFHMCTEMPILAFSSLLHENKKIPVTKCYPQWE